MATLTAARAAQTFPVFKGEGSGALSVAYGSYTLAANPTANDIIQFCRLPAGSVVVGGWLRADDLDTGTEALDIDIGWAANGVEAADSDGFGNFGVISGNAVTNVKPEVSVMLTLNGTLKSGPVSFTNETIVQGVVNAAANAGGTGTIWVTILYVTP